MTARNKLNLIYLHGACLLAGCAGLLTGSWSWGLWVLVAVIAIAFVSNDLRLPPSHSRRGRN